jgi:hypothetical protein
MQDSFLCCFFFPLDPDVNVVVEKLADAEGGVEGGEGEPCTTPSSSDSTLNPL